MAIRGSGLKSIKQLAEENGIAYNANDATKTDWKAIEQLPNPEPFSAIVRLNMGNDITVDVHTNPKDGFTMGFTTVPGVPGLVFQGSEPYQALTTPAPKSTFTEETPAVASASVTGAPVRPGSGFDWQHPVKSAKRLLAGIKLPEA